MPVSVSELIHAPRKTVWNIIADIENAEAIVSSILELEVLEKPQSGLLGLKWREKRLMFGKEAEETMWVSDLEDGFWYETTAHNHGMIYISRMAVEDVEDGCVLTMSFNCFPQTARAKLFALLSFLFNGAVKKAFASDLADMKRAAEARQA